MADSIIRQYYQSLGRGVLKARKCKSCGAVTFPPTSACCECGSSDQDWVELSGRGKMMYVSHGMAPPPNPRFNDLAPYAYGHILLDEGVWIQAIVSDVAIDPESLRKMFEKGPSDVVKDIKRVGDLDILAFRPI
jgi:uncharacterized OB-fold protein